MNVQIQSTSICNATCTCCPYASTIADRPRGVMGLRTWIAVLGALQARKWDTVCLYLQAEPLTDPKLASRIHDVRWGVECDRLEIATNCSLLTVSRTTELLDAIGDKPMTWGLSFQGVEREGFEERTGLFWEPCLEHLRTFLVRTDGNGHRRVIRSVSCTAAKSFWHREFESLGLQDWPEVHGDPGVSRAGSVGPGTVLHTGEGWTPNCVRLRDWLHIAVDGKVVSCCDDYSREAIIGDLMTQGLGEVLDNREPVVAGLCERADFLCRRCERAG